MSRTPQEILDTERMGRMQVVAVTICVLLNALDGFDVPLGDLVVWVEECAVEIDREHINHGPGGEHAMRIGRRV